VLHAASNKIGKAHNRIEKRDLSMPCSFKIRPPNSSVLLI
jgi:hypothetical protein